MTAIDQSKIDVGARSPGLTFQDLLDADTHPVPDVLRLQSPRYFGSDDIPTERYTSREWHRREVDQLWSRVWQFACREEHIPEPGDYIVYEIAELSFLVVRQTDGSIKSYPNACLHRGRQPYWPPARQPDERDHNDRLERADRQPVREPRGKAKSEESHLFFRRSRCSDASNASSSASSSSDTSSRSAR